MSEVFKTKDECSFEIYPEIKEKVILDALIGESITYNLPEETTDVLIESWNSRFWVTDGFDGATIVRNKKHPSISNFFHDYFYRCGFATGYKNGKMVDVIYKNMLKKTGYKSISANSRYGALRVFGSIFRIGHRIKGNKNKPSKAMIDLYNALT